MGLDYVLGTLGRGNWLWFLIFGLRSLIYYKSRVHLSNRVSTSGQGGHHYQGAGFGVLRPHVH
jgi:hypothetical protein